MKNQSRTVKFKIGESEHSISVYDKKSLDSLATLCRQAKAAGAISSYGYASQESAPIMEARSADGVRPPEKTPAFRVVQGGGGASSRRFPRFKKKFRILLISGIRTFHTNSHEISVGGMLLEQALPANFLRPDQKCKLLVCDEAHNIEFESEIIEDQFETSRLRFTKLDTASGKTLGNWLERTKLAETQMDTALEWANSLAI